MQHDGLGVSMADLDEAVDNLFAFPTSKPKPVLADVNPELHEGMPFEEYQRHPSVSASGLRLIGKSPLHFWHRNLRPGAVAQESTEAQRLGTAIHCAVLEPGAFDVRFAIRPDCDRRTKDGKAEYAAFIETLGDRTELKQDQAEAALEVAASVRATEMGRKFLANGAPETTAIWTDRETGVRIRVRPDFVPAGHPLLLDLKSTTDASERAFSRSAWAYGYHVTAALYLDGWKAVTGEKREYCFVAWEKEPPYASAWYYADQTLLEAGRHEYRRLLRIYADCLAADKWPGYPAMLCPLFPPAWAMDKD